MRRRTMKWIPLLVLVAAAGAGAAMAATSARHARAGTVSAAKAGGLGMVLVGSNRHVLYRYTPDRKGHSVCTGSCLKLWPPLLVKTKPVAGPGVRAKLLGTIEAARHELQVTYAGYPLYFFAGDKAALQAKGQGYGGIWYAVNAKGALVKHAAPAPTGGGTSTTSGGGGGAWG